MPSRPVATQASEVGTDARLAASRSAVLSVTPYSGGALATMLLGIRLMHDAIHFPHNDAHRHEKPVDGNLRLGLQGFDNRRQDLPNSALSDLTTCIS